MHNQEDGLDPALKCIHANMTKQIITGKYTPPSRQGKHLIGAHFPADTKRKLKAIAAENDTSIQALLEQAVETSIKKHEKTSQTG